MVYCRITEEEEPRGIIIMWSHLLRRQHCIVTRGISLNISRCIPKGAGLGKFQQVLMDERHNEIIYHLGVDFNCAAQVKERQIH